MATNTFPELRIEGFTGVDYTSDDYRLPLEAVTAIEGLRVDTNGNVIGFGALGSGKALGSGGTKAMGGSWFKATNQIVLGTYTVGYNNNTIGQFHLHVAPVIGFDGTSDFTVINTTGINFTQGHELLTLAESYEKMFIQVYKEPLLYWDGANTGGAYLTELSTADTDLDDSGDSDDTLKFAGIATHDGHLMGWGYGDESTGHDAEETKYLGADRPEMLRWSHLGQPLKWRPENWLMVGTRGLPILAGVSAFGRFVVLKEEGVWLVYGSLEENLPIAEPLYVEKGRAAGATGSRAFAVYDNALYWMSRYGPMRWAGGNFAEYIGYPVEGDLVEQWRNSSCMVVPCPEMNGVLFMCHNSPELPFIGWGDAKYSEGSPHQFAWLWDTNRGVWAGKADLGTSIVQSAFVAPTEKGKMRVLFDKAKELGPITASSSSSDTMGAETGTFTTSKVRLNENRGAVVRGLVIEGDFQPDDSATATWDITINGSTVKQFYIGNSAPSASEAGDIWYDADGSLSYEATAA